MHRYARSLTLASALLAALSAQAQATYSLNNAVIFEGVRGVVTGISGSTYSVTKLCPTRATTAVAGVTADKLTAAPALVNPNLSQGSHASYKESTTAAAVAVRVITAGWSSSCGGSYGLYIPATDKYLWSVSHDKLTAAAAPNVDAAALKAAIVAEHNRVRKNPAGYATELAALKDDLLKANASDSTYAYALDSAIKQLGAGGALSAARPELAPTAGAGNTSQQSLASAAQAHATWLDANPGQCGGDVHRGPKAASGACLSLGDRLTTAKYAAANMAENVGSGASAKEIVRGFIVDNGESNKDKWAHRITILSADYTEIGVGYNAKGAAVIDFGKPR